VKTTDDPATDALIAELTEAAGEIGLDVEQSDGKTKYGSDNLVLGLPKISASGISTFVNCDGRLLSV